MSKVNWQPIGDHDLLRGWWKRLEGKRSRLDFTDESEWCVVVDIVKRRIASEALSARPTNEECEAFAAGVAAALRAILPQPTPPQRVVCRQCASELASEYP